LPTCEAGAAALSALKEEGLLEQAEQAIINPIDNNFAERLIGSSRIESMLKVTELIRA
jgi:hypothetical protein